MRIEYCCGRPLISAYIADDVLEHARTRKGVINCHYMLLLLQAETLSASSMDSEVVRKSFDHAIAMAGKLVFCITKRWGTNGQAFTLLSKTTRRRYLRILAVLANSSGNGEQWQRLTRWT